MKSRTSLATVDAGGRSYTCNFFSAAIATPAGVKARQQQEPRETDGRRIAILGVEDRKWKQF
jgi:hypothetical protein